MTLFTIITGIASIISQFLPFVPTIGKWKIYFLYCGLFLAGLTTGVIASSLEQGINSVSSEQIGVIIVSLFIVGLIALVSYLLIKKGQDMLGYIVLILGIGTYLPLNIDKINPPREIFSPTDILILEQTYENRKDYFKAAELMKNYKESKAVMNNSELVKTADEKIAKLHLLQQSQIKN